MKGSIMFNKIKTLKEQNLKITQTARILNSDVRIINKYWNMSSEEFELLRTQYKQRIVRRKMDIYVNNVSSLGLKSSMILVALRYLIGLKKESKTLVWLKGPFDNMLKNLGKNKSYLNSKFHDNSL